MLSLPASKGAFVKLTLTVPSSAALGSYAALIAAGSTFGAATKGQSARFGDQAATKLAFTVTTATAAASKAKHKSGGIPGPWWAWVLGVVAVVVLYLVQRSGIRLRIERKS